MKIETVREDLEINGKKQSLFKLVGNSASEIVRLMRELAMDDHKFPRIPGPNPISIERKDFEKLKTKEYVIAEKTDGIRFVMIFTKMFEHNICAIIDRAMNAYLIPLRVIPRVLFQGTIFDGELTIDKRGRSCFILFDSITVSGITVSQLNLESRLIALQRSLKDFKMHVDDPIELRFKSWTNLNSPDVMKKITSAEDIYHTDGVILMAKDDPVIYGRNFEMFKMKPRGTHTIDFIVIDTNGTIGVFDPKSNRDTAIGKIKGNYKAGTIVECNLSHGVWNVIGIRKDKKQANDILTYERTLVNIREDIQIEELLRLYKTNMASF